jgi:hypothetical protein
VIKSVLVSVHSTHSSYIATAQIGDSSGVMAVGVCRGCVNAEYKIVTVPRNYVFLFTKWSYKLKQVELKVYFSFTVKWKIWHAMHPQRARERPIRTHCLRYCNMSGIDHSYFLTAFNFLPPCANASVSPLVSLAFVLIALYSIYT